MSEFWIDVVTGIFSTVVGGVALAFLAYIFGEYWFGVPFVGGSWVCVLEVDETTHPSYQNMVMTYRVHLLQSGRAVTGFGELIRDQSIERGYHEYPTDKRRRIDDVHGYIERGVFQKSTLHLVYQADGERRKTSACLNLKIVSSQTLSGYFEWTAANKYGRSEWRRFVPVEPSALSEEMKLNRQAHYAITGFIVYGLALMAKSFRLWGVDEGYRKALIKSSQVRRVDLDPRFIEAALIAEDKRFFLHPGFDWIAILRAIKANLTGASRQGGSTIDQQLVRTLMEDFRPTFERKWKEILVACLYAKQSTKRSTLQLYFASVYFGKGMVGLRKACDMLGMDRKNLTDHDICRLVAYIRFPKGSDLKREKKAELWAVHLHAKFDEKRRAERGLPIEPIPK